jgi:23S rRNA (guanosine2251-2'-O)-methyltransferase
VPGNSKRRGAVRKATKGNPTAGSGGRVRRGLEGKGPTPRASDRPGHVAQHRGRSAGPRAQPTGGPRARGGRAGAPPGGAEWVLGRNAAVEALRAGVPVTAVYVADQPLRDQRVREVFASAGDRGLAVLQVPRAQLDRMTGEAVHQGVALQVPAYDYAHPDDLLAAPPAGRQARGRALIVALDGVTDPRNLGAVVRSAAAFGAAGVVVPERRAAGMTASAWKSSAGAAARLPVARATNLARQLKAYQAAGLSVVGLDAGGDAELPGLDLATEPLVLVVGSEGKGLSRLVAQTCDVLARIPITAAAESLNAGVAAGIALYEIDRIRRAK